MARRFRNFRNLKRGEIKNEALLIALFIFAGILILGSVAFAFYSASQSQKATELLAQQFQLSASSTIESANEKIAATEAQPRTTKSPETIQSTPKITQSTNEMTDTQIYKKASPSVVYIETENELGSGMIISSDGYILTNAHVLKGVTVAKVTLASNYAYFATVVGRDEYTDLAILKAPVTNLTPISLGDSDSLTPGDRVCALGFPFGLQGEVSIKCGELSRRIMDNSQQYLEHTAETHPGNSGGPLVDAYGKVIGINSDSFGTSLGDLQLGETIKWAIPINVAKSEISSLENGTSFVKSAPVNNSTSQTSYPPPPLSDEQIGVNYYLQNHTCVGLGGDQYDYCLSYALNH